MTEDHRNLTSDNDGCDCTELCSMGPTCPGGVLAGLSGSGCGRAQAADRDENWLTREIKRARKRSALLPEYAKPTIIRRKS